MTARIGPDDARLKAVYVARVAASFLRSPAEGLDQVRNRIALLRGTTDAARATPPVDPDWERAFHRALGAPWPCPESEAFDALWSTVQADVSDPGVPSELNLDADPTLARAAWCAVRHLRPERVVETGVSRGITSRFILEGLERNDQGHLWSIDLPPIGEPWASQVGIAVPAELKHRWTYLRGASRRLLPPLCAHLGELDVFVHDSLHTTENVRFELTTAAQSLRAGGVLLVDDVDDNHGFDGVRTELGGYDSIVAAQSEKGGAIGIAVKERA